MMWSYTADVPDDFPAGLVALAADLSTPTGTCDPADLLGCWFSESDMLATAHNPNGHAVGIFQAMPATLKGLGYAGDWQAFRRLNATEQLEWARRYYMPHKGRLTNAGAVYLANFLPALMGHAGDSLFVLCGWRGPLAWAYAPNRVFDADGKGYITVGDLSARVAAVTHGPRWDELLDRLHGATAPCPDSGPANDNGAPPADAA